MTGRTKDVCYKCRHPYITPDEIPYGPDCYRQIQAAVHVLQAYDNPVANRAAALLMTGGLAPTSRPGVWLAHSQHEPNVSYLVTVDNCACPQGQRFPHRICKHRLAAGVLAA